ncbi:MAG: DUF1501 domain-containing protein [Gemmataceae bacterium]|nr:DUF1501 domain-containing protein [Gemmataceae bacterium]
MISLPAAPVRLCDGPSRRELLRAGSLGALGLSLPGLLRLQQAQAAPARRAPADAVILVYCWGAPSQFEILDPKPDAPAEIRGEFGAIQTQTPGVVLGEHVPLLAQRTKHFTIVRTCRQSSTSHQPGAYEALTGFAPTRNAVSLIASAADYPNLGSVVSKFAARRSDLPPFVTLPQLISDVGNLTPGQFSGFLGRQYDPLTVQRDPNAAGFKVEEMTLPPEMSTTRLDDRQSLLRLVNGQMRALEQSATAGALDSFQDRAFRMLSKPAVQRAFDLEREKPTLRDEYGRTTFGQSCLLARRLVESGVKLVSVFSANAGKIPQDAWDTHSNNFKHLKNTMLPPFDRGVSALLDDLQRTGLAERTLLVVMSEFGRSPRINPQAGRDHWANSYSIMMTGGGVKPGQVHGQSDKIGAYAQRGRVFSTADTTATIYHCLGIDPRTEVNDQAGRPLPITTGEPMTELF